jgi:hypothetical protein
LGERWLSSTSGVLPTRLSMEVFGRRGGVVSGFVGMPRFYLLEPISLHRDSEMR